MPSTILPYTLLASTSVAGSAHTGTTPAIDTTGADLLVVAGGWNDTTSRPTLSDSLGNVYTLIAEAAASTFGPTAFYALHLFVCVAPVVGVAHTWTLAGTRTFPLLHVQAFSGVRRSPAPLVTTATGLATNVAAVSSLPFTPEAPGQLLTTACLFLDNSGGAVTLTGTRSGYTLTDTIPFASNGSTGGGMGYAVVQTRGVDTITWDLTTSASREITVVGVLAHAAEPPVVPPLGWMAPSTIVIAGR